MTPRRAPLLATILAASLLLTACSSSSDDEPKAEASATPSATATPVEQTQFTRDGTFQSHVDVDGIDFVYTLYPTKSTPRTNEWYPQGKKYFTVTLTAYDLDRRLRDPFKTKRRVFLDRIRATSTTSTTASGDDSSAGTDDTTDGSTAAEPYRLSAKAEKITFDPEPQKSKRYGMLITSPKGSFELRNQYIGTVSADTREVTLSFAATVWIQNEAGEKGYYSEVVRQDVPITIFASKQATKAADIPIDAN